MEALVPIAAAVSLSLVQKILPIGLKKMFGNSDNKLKQAKVEQEQEMKQAKVEQQHELKMIQERGKQELAMQKNKNQHQRDQELAEINSKQIVSKAKSKHEMNLFEAKSRTEGKVRKMEIEAQEREFERNNEQIKQGFEVERAKVERNHEIQTQVLQVKERKGQRVHKEKLLGLEEEKEARKDRETRVGKKEQNFHNREEKRIKFKFSYLMARLLLVLFVSCLIFKLLSKLQVIEVNTQTESWFKMIKLKGWKPDPEVPGSETESYFKRTDQPVIEPTTRIKTTEL